MIFKLYSNNQDLMLFDKFTGFSVHRVKDPKDAVFDREGDLFDPFGCSVVLPEGLLYTVVTLTDVSNGRRDSVYKMLLTADSFLCSDDGKTIEKIAHFAVQDRPQPNYEYFLDDIPF